MTDKEKVIRAIDGCINIGDYCNDCDYDGCVFHHGSCEKDLLADALALLKEQEPKLIIGKDSFGGIETGTCPRCDNLIVNNQNNPTKFCRYCGQEVTWE